MSTQIAFVPLSPAITRERQPARALTGLNPPRRPPNLATPLRHRRWAARPAMGERDRRRRGRQEGENEKGKTPHHSGAIVDRIAHLGVARDLGSFSLESSPARA